MTPSRIGVNQGAMPDHAPSLENEARDATNAPLVERRRPGRAEYGNPALVAILRGSPTDTVAPVFDEEDGLAPAKGLMLGVPLGILSWAVVAAIAWLLVG